MAPLFVMTNKRRMINLDHVIQIVKSQDDDETLVLEMDNGQKLFLFKSEAKDCWEYLTSMVRE